MSFRALLLLIASGLVVAFIVQNAQSVELRFLLWTLSLSQALLLFFVFAAGLLCGWILHAIKVHRRKTGKPAPE